MKAIRIILAGALLIGSSAASFAQTAEETINAAAQVIKSNAPDMQAQLKQIYKKNKKNAQVMTGIARVFYDRKDTANARVYVDYAIAANGKYAPAYILSGDLKAVAEDGGGAAQEYQQAIYFDPKNPDAYIKYASVYRKISPTEAVGKLEELRSQRPDIAVDALEGRIYYRSNEFDKAIDCFGKAELGKMEENDITNYAMSLWFTQKYDKSLEIAKFGLTKLPRDAAFNRLAFFNYTDLKDYDNALVYADKLFNQSDSAKFSYFDYTYYGNALSGVKKHTEAIEMYKKALEQKFDDPTKRSGVLKTLSEGYKQNDDYPNAIKTYEEFLSSIKSVQATDMVGLGQLHTLYASQLKGDEMKAELDKADQVYADMAEKFPDAKEYSLFMRARGKTYLDPETKEGLAKPFYEELAGIIEPRPEKAGADRARIIEAYSYLGYYYLQKDDKANSDMYWNKLLQIDPNNEKAKLVLGIK